MEKMQLSYSCFFPLARKLRHPDLSTARSLTKFLFGTASNAAIFEQLIYWLPKAKRKDGAVYKSDAELGQEIGCSAKTIERSRSVMKAAGFTIKIIKANGTPTNHYYFDLEKFLAFAAKKLNVETETVREGLFANVEKSSEKISDKMSKWENRQAQNVAVTPDTMSEHTRQGVEEKCPQRVESDFDKMPGSSTLPNQADQTANIQTQEATTTHIPLYEGLCGHAPEEEVVVDSPDLKDEICILNQMLGIAEKEIEKGIARFGLDYVKVLAKHAVEDEKIRNRSGWAFKGLQTQYGWAKPQPKRKYVGFGES